MALAKRRGRLLCWAEGEVRSAARRAVSRHGAVAAATAQRRHWPGAPAARAQHRRNGSFGAAERFSADDSARAGRCTATLTRLALHPVAATDLREGGCMRMSQALLQHITAIR